jgi:hypothetical protein
MDGGAGGAPGSCEMEKPGGNWDGGRAGGTEASPWGPGATDPGAIAGGTERESAGGN